MWRSRGFIPIAALLLVAAFGGVDRAEVLDRMAPGIDPRFVTHLVHDDDDALRAYCRHAGRALVGRSYEALNGLLYYSPDDQYPARLRELSPYLQRLADVYSTVFQNDCTRDDLVYRAALGARVFELNRSIRDLDALQADAVSSTESKIRRYRVMQSAFARFGYERGVMITEAALSGELARAGRPAERLPLLRSALARARRLGDDLMMCQLLGEMGADFWDRHPDSLLACYQEGIAIADRHRIAEQATRLRVFLAAWYANHGRLALAADLAREAHITCRRLGGGPYEMRPVLFGVRSFADLGCWDIVDLQLERLLPLLRIAREEWGEREVLYYEIDALRFEARLLAHHGQAAAAVTLIDSLLESRRPALSRVTVGRLLVERASALLAAGREAQALAAARRGLAYSDSFHLLDAVTDLELVRGEAAVRMRDFDQADSALAHGRALAAERNVPEPLRGTACDALSARIALARGDVREARRRFEAGYRTLRAGARRLDPGPRSQLLLFQAGAMRDVGHTLLAGDASADLGFELSWRSLPGLFGRPPDAAGARSADPSWLAGDRSILLVYGLTPQGLTRWCRRGGRVRRDVLAADPTTIDRRVAAVVPAFSSEPDSLGSPMPDSLRDLLVDLGARLLPEDVRRDTSLRVVIAAEGTLALLPFECLDVGERNHYEPLLARHDVVYARPTPIVARRRHDPTTALLLGADREDGLAGGEGPPLAAVEAEAAAVRARLPNVRVYRSGEASKRSVLDAWEKASVVYVAAHLLRDREAPLLSRFPMKAGLRPDHLEDGSLDLLDARTIDLSGCRLAVLSSCASGEPYVIGDRTGPSMADALLDAGAAAVIHTRWNVRDDRAAILAPALASAWIQGRSDPIAAWCRIRRLSMGGPGGWRHPFEWGAWSATIALPWEPRRGEERPAKEPRAEAPAVPGPRAASAARAG